MKARILSAAAVAWSLAACAPPIAPPPVAPASTVVQVVGTIDAAQLMDDPVVGPGALAPDGSVVAYGDGGRLYLVGVHDGVPAPVADVNVADLYWDGGRLVIDGSAGWLALDEAGGRLERLASAPAPALPSGIAPDQAGRAVPAPAGPYAGQVAVIYKGDLWIGMPGHGADQVTTGLKAFGTPVWRPDGRRLAVAAEGPDRYLDIYEIGLALRQVRRLYGTAEDDLPVGYLPDGRLLVASYFHRDEIALVGAGGALRPIVAGLTPRFEPDGLHLGYTGGRPFRLADLVVHYPALDMHATLLPLRASGEPDGAPVEVVRAPVAETTPLYTSDGRWFVNQSLEGGQDEIWLRDAMGGRPRALSKGGRETGQPALSPDDRHVVWSSRTGEGPETAALFAASFDPDSGETTPPAALPVSGYRGEMEDPRFSGDGSHLLFVGAGETPHHRAVYVLPAAGGEARKVVELDSDDPHGGAVFGRDGRSIVYAAYGPGGYDLYDVPLAGGTPARLTTGSWSKSQPTVAPNGLLACTVWRHTVTLALLSPER